MHYCHACDAQFPDEHARCLHCGGELRSEPLGQSLAGPAKAVTDGLTLLARRQPMKAIPLLETLSAAGIEFTVIGDGGVENVNVRYGSYGSQAAIEVYVRPESLAEAEAVLREELAPLTQHLPEHATHEPGRCPACASQLPEVAGECPDCGLVFSG